MLEVKNVNIDIGNRVIVSGVTVSVEFGQSWAIMGANGAGKSSLLRVFAGINKPSNGDVLFDGKSIHDFPKKSLAQKIGLLPQFEEHDYWGNVEEYVGLGGFSRSIGLWDKSDEDRVIIQEALEQFEMQNLRGRDYRSLSGGERQRARLASLMVQDPNLFLWDEPLENLDYSGRAKLLSWVAEMTKTAEKASMMVMHDINLANRFFTHSLMLFEDGTCLSGTSEDVLTVENLEALYRTQFDQVISQDRRLFLPRFR